MIHLVSRSAHQRPAPHLQRPSHTVAKCRPERPRRRRLLSWLRHGAAHAARPTSWHNDRALSIPQEPDATGGVATATASAPATGCSQPPEGEPSLPSMGIRRPGMSCPVFAITPFTNRQLAQRITVRPRRRRMFRGESAIVSPRSHHAPRGTTRSEQLNLLGTCSARVPWVSGAAVSGGAYPCVATNPAAARATLLSP